MLDVIVISRKEVAVDPVFFVLHGIALEGLRRPANKASNHVRAAFAARCVAILACESPGPGRWTWRGCRFSGCRPGCGQ
jgi:microcystin degradation protein MlrC